MSENEIISKVLVKMDAIPRGATISLQHLIQQISGTYAIDWRALISEMVTLKLITERGYDTGQYIVTELGREEARKYRDTDPDASEQNSER